nr:FAD-dependent oxidoreductase [Streptomyces sp. So13.3]
MCQRFTPPRLGYPRRAPPRRPSVGAGLAGLRCAHQLWNRGKPVAATVYEADITHLGGRRWSLRGFFDNGQVSEHGGVFISSTDTAILKLAATLGLKREYANCGALDTGDYVTRINNSTYTGAQQQSDWDGDVYNAFSASYGAAGTARYSPWHLGAYHCYKVGQYTSFAGYEGVQEGRIHFAGEHTDVDNSTLNAAVASGERAASEITTQI